MLALLLFGNLCDLLSKQRALGVSILCLVLLHLINWLIRLPRYPPRASSVALFDPTLLIIIHGLGLMLSNNSLWVILPCQELPLWNIGLACTHDLSPLHVLLRPVLW